MTPPSTCIFKISCAAVPSTPDTTLLNNSKAFVPEEAEIRFIELEDPATSDVIINTVVLDTVADTGVKPVTRPSKCVRAFAISRQFAVRVTVWDVPLISTVKFSLELAAPATIVWFPNKAKAFVSVVPVREIELDAPVVLDVIIKVLLPESLRVAPAAVKAAPWAVTTAAASVAFESIVMVAGEPPSTVRIKSSLPRVEKSRTAKVSPVKVPAVARLKSKPAKVPPVKTPAVSAAVEKSFVAKLVPVAVPFVSITEKL